MKWYRIFLFPLVLTMASGCMESENQLLPLLKQAHDAQKINAHICFNVANEGEYDGRYCMTKGGK